jgi:signal transduction histidine kinase
MACWGLYRSRLASNQISVHTKYGDCEVFGYAGELRQLLANLCANAIDAVQSRGTLSVKVSRSHAWRNSNEPGIRVTIADDGCGIPAEHLDSVFQPFFTTKEATGTGLGLWVAKQINERHGGWITIRSRANPSQHYTVVSVFLPLRGEGRLQEFAVAS